MKRNPSKWIPSKPAWIYIHALGLAVLVAPLANRSLHGPPAGNPQDSAWSLESPAFTQGGTIPVKFTCSGEDVSPALRWGEPPAGTRCLALIGDDPDAPVGTWVHWVAFDLPASARALLEAVPKTAEIKGGGRQGRNDFEKLGYGGPCPPPGKPHRYFFKLYALDRELGLKPGATKAQVEEAMKGHVVAKAELMGRYGR